MIVLTGHLTLQKREQRLHIGETLAFSRTWTLHGGAPDLLFPITGLPEPQQV